MGDGQVAGVEGQGAVLYVEDHQVTNEEVLETINSLLSSASVRFTQSSCSGTASWALNYALR